MSTILNTIHTESDEYVNAVKVGGTKISFDILKRRYYVSTLENIDESDKVIRLVASVRGKDTVEFSKSK